MDQDNERMDGQQGDSGKASDTDYVAAIKELKANSVPKEEYDRVLARERELLDAYLNGGKQADEQPQEERKSVEELREELFGGKKLNNLVYVTKALQLRDELIARGDVDPFLPVTVSGVPSAEDRAMAEYVAQVYRECVEIADGSSEIFTRELMRRTKDVNLPKRK